MIAPMILSLVFYAAFAVYSLFGVYILLADRKSIVNRIFFAVCLSLCFWSFGFALTDHATDLATALFWRRFSALGWGTLYAFLLHFVVRMTRFDRWLRRGWQVVLLYLPAALTVFVYSIYSPLVNVQYNLLQNDWGWVNISVNSVFDWIFNVYFATYTIASVVLVIRWQKIVDRSQKRTVAICLGAFVAAFILGSLTDIVMPYFVDFPVPQIGSIFILMPVAALYNCVRKHRIMQAPEDVRRNDLEKISYMSHTMSQVILQNAVFKDEGELSFFTNKLTSMLYFPSLMVGSIINLTFYSFFPTLSFVDALINSLGFLLIAHAFYICNNLIKNEVGKSHAFNVLVIFLLIFLFLRYYSLIGPAIWTAAFIFVMLAMSRNDRKMLTALSFVLLTMGIYLAASDVPFVMGTTYYVAQFLLFALMFVIAIIFYFINARRRTRIKEQLDQMILISHVSKSFVTVSGGNIDAKILDLLHLSGEHLKADRAYFYQSAYNQDGIKFTHEWCRDGVSPVTSRSVDANNGDCYRPDSQALTIPVICNEKVLGCLGFEKSVKGDCWRYEHSDMLSVLANTVGDALTKLSAETEINRMAFFDELTGLPNRVCFVDRLAKEIDLAQANDDMIGLLFIDLDSFKSVNDSLGHDGGDELLQRVARRLTDSVRSHDMIARFGGDEYLVMLTQLKDAEDICRIADKLMKALNKSLAIKGQEFFITASTGIAVYPIDGSDPSVLIKNADLAMYASKNEGKNKFTLCSPILKEETLAKSKLTTSLYRALDRKELLLYYQPQIDVASKQIIGLEALLRWNHPQMGMIPPSTFIPLAEQTGLINPIGEWVLMSACRQNLAWQKLGIPPLRVAVNLSVVQFKNPGLVNIVRNVLHETGLSAEYLELEITESVAVNSPDHIIQVLNELKQLGTSISIDDFGVEYSSLNRLKLLPVDRIKMDMQFVHSISKSLKDDAIARIIIQLARNLDLKVIAEGVETETQLNFLTNQVCDEVQGYFYYKPMPAAEIEAILLAQRDLNGAVQNL